MSFAISFPHKTVPSTRIATFFAVAGATLAYGFTLLLAPLSLAMFSALILFGWSAGTIAAASIIAATTDQAQWNLLMRGQLLSLASFVLMCGSILF